MTPQILQSRDLPDTILPGTTVLYPTETVYGLGCRFDDSEALKHIYRLKGRAAGVPVALICDTKAWVKAHFKVPRHAEKLMDAYWPGPLAMLLRPKKPGQFRSVVYQDHVGIRVSGLELARALARASGGAFVSTSANLSGEETPLHWHDCPLSIQRGVSFIVDGGCLQPSPPSTLIRITKSPDENGGFDVIRQGSIELP